MAADNNFLATVSQLIDDSDGVTLDLSRLDLPGTPLLLQLPLMIVQRMPRLRRVRLRFGPSVTDKDCDSFRRLAKDATLPDGHCLLSDIESLNFLNSDVTDEALIRLLAAPGEGIPLTLRSLGISSFMTDKAVLAIATAADLGTLKALESFHISRQSRVTDDGLAGLFCSIKRGALPNLQSLTIGGAFVTDQSVQHLCNAMDTGALSHLKTLALANTYLTPEGIVALARTLQGGHSPHLETVDLIDAWESEEVTLAVARAATGSMRQLRSLRLRSKSATDEGILGLASAAEAGGLPQLHSLVLGHAPVSDKGMMGLAQAAELGGFPKLHLLNLEWTSVSDKGIVRLARAAKASGLPQLQWLNLWNTSVSDKGVLALARAADLGGMRQLQSLNLWDTSVTDEGILGLVRAADKGGLPHLQLLNVDWTSVSDKSVLAIAHAAKAGSLLELRSLMVNCAGVTDSGVLGLLHATDAGALKHLKRLKVHAISATIPTEVSSSLDARAIFNWYRERELQRQKDRALSLFQQIDLSYWLKDLVAFWCIGYVEREALMLSGDALGWESLRKELKTLKSAHDISGLSVSQGHIRGAIERLESMFNSHPFIGDLWAEDERSPDFRAERMHGRRKESRWTLRARKAWQLVDWFLEMKGLKPIVENARGDCTT